MTIKKKLFISNTIMIFLSLSILLAIGGGLIAIFKDEVFATLGEASEINGQIAQVERELLEPNNAGRSAEEWSQRMAAYDFRIYMLNENGKKLYSNLRHGEKEAVEVIQGKQFQEGTANMYLLEGATIVATQITQTAGAYTMIAVSSDAKKHTFYGLDRGIFEKFIISFLLTGILAIIVILVCGQIFSRRFIHHVMSPLDKLNEAVCRIGEGNLDEPIAYGKEDEYKPVCDSFDQMQKSLKASMEKQLVYEKARTEMISGISHDLRTPLTSIKGYVKGMMDGIANTEEKRQHYLKTAYKKSCDMDILLSKLFYFSKLETGNMPFFPQKTDMSQLIAQYVEEKASEERQRIEFEVEDKLSEKAICDIDKEQTKRVFDNLVENSKKYADVQQLRIHIALQLERQRRSP